MSPVLKVTPESSRIDSPIQITAAGLMPRERVTIRTNVMDGALREWESIVAVNADSAGMVDLSRMSPLEGSTYQGVDGEGPLWSMLGPDRSKFFTRNFPVELEYHSELLRDDSVIASTRFRRHFGADVKCDQVHEPPVVGTFAHPSDDLPHPGVLLLHGSDSVDLAGAAKLLASEGYSVLALRWFGIEDRPLHMVNIDLNDIDRVVKHMLNDDFVLGDHIAVIGLSRGAELGLELAANNANIGLTIALSPSSIRQAGMGENYSFKDPAWVRNGEPLEWVPSGNGFGMMISWLSAVIRRKPMRQKRSFLKDLNKKVEAVEKSTIRVENCKGSIALIFGDDDGLWPSKEYSDRIVSRLKDADWPGNLRVECLPGAGHFVGFPYALPTLPPMCILKPTSFFSIDFGGSASANAESAKKIWQIVQEELSRWSLLLITESDRRSSGENC
ncbi:acyl-CoA thioesterase/bile acid-CoA:amino acid N-acyltransferase family protein [Trueperella pyogenes]|uniref:acyl-CoA thioesterase/bile acid-CoA:amino acid N-acyltransferase family protein n=1 Tax=Trueperella pyogenes TaxID=1661 RepID=UPI00345D8330